MNGSLEPLLPALDNPAVFAVITLLLVALVTISAAARLFGTMKWATPGSVRRLRVATGVAGWLVSIFWLVLGAGMIAFAGAVGGSLLVVVIGAVVFLIAFPLISLWLLFWSRGRVWADWLTLALVGSLCLTVVATQRLWICEPLAWGGFTPAQLCTARLYAEGSQGAIRNTGIAASWYGEAALNGSEVAVRRLMTVTRNKRTQRRYLEEAALAGNEAAMYHLAMLLGPVEGRRWLDMAIDQGQADALYQKSLYHRSGEYGFDRDVALADDLLKEAAERGSPGAAADLSFAFETGDRPFGHSRIQSLFWEARVDDQWPGYERWQARLARQRGLRDRISNGDTAAMLELAHRYQSRARQEPAYAADARAWLRKAAEAGSAEGQYELASFHFKREEATEGEMADARRFLRAAADQQHRYALSNLSGYLMKGQRGYPVDYAGARDYARTLVTVLSAESRPNQRDLDLARARLAEAERLLAQELAWEEGLDALQSGAVEGDADALYQLYEKHVSDRQRGDFETAQALLLAAAEQGHVEARFRIADRTLSQPRTPEEEARAYQWMADAAANGHRGALVSMGRIHLRGVPKHGIEQNSETAREELERALAGLEGDVVYARRNGSRTVATMRGSVERLLAGIETTSNGQ